VRGRVGVILSGGNIGLERFISLLSTRTADKGELIV
jgi:hypothetical protein